MVEKPQTFHSVCSTLSWDSTLTECKGTIYIRKSTTVMFWINCQFEDVTLFNTKFQGENSVLPLYKSLAIMLHHQGKL